MTGWSTSDSEELYLVPHWASGYFSVGGAGNVVAHPDGDREHGVDLSRLVGDLRRRGIDPPVLLRFDGILQSRVRELVGAFENARAEFEYPGTYHPVFPIKVNQERHVVEALLAEGESCGLGLEVGSKPELFAVLAMERPEGALVVCNGYKDREYVEAALSARQLGLEAILVIEKYSELAEVLSAAEGLGIPPVIGARIKLGGPGSGRWRESGGSRSKFGLTTRQLVQLVEELESRGMLDRLQLLHYHIGSQVTDIRSIKSALREAARTYVGLAKMGARLRWLDVGGGLGIDYDGSSSTSDSSVNYSMQEYANDVVYQIKQTCREAGVEPPAILSESGRAIAAHHAVLVAEVIGVADFTTVGVPQDAEPGEHALVHEFADVCGGVSADNFHEAYHDALQLRDRATMLFDVGQLSLPDRARAEEFFWRICEKVLRITRRLDHVPDDVEGLELDLADTYFVNCSIFQSLPDSWAVDQLFPVLPLHRLDEQPTRHGVLADLTCDSDGKVDRFIGLGEAKPTLELHPLDPAEPYYLGFFLVGAYQEILGDMHNLFGDTNTVHVGIGKDGRTRISRVLHGDRVKDVLAYVEYNGKDLVASLRKNLERAIESDRLSFEDSARLQRMFDEGLAGYTYLERNPEERER